MLEGDYPMPDTTPRTLALGAATITIINVGDMMFDLTEALNVSESAWRPQYGTAFEGRRPYPSQSVHIALPGASMLVDANRELTPEVRIIAAPGESPGHQVVRVHSRGQTFYCLGDLCHHAVELEHPEWMVEWADAEASLASRRALIEAALAENAMLV